MASFLSTTAMTSKSTKRPYKIEEDRIICEGLEDGDTVREISNALESEGFDRTVLSLRYRVAKLREAAEKYETLEAFHANKK